MILIRPHAWWFNKVPLSVLMLLLLLAGRPFTWAIGTTLAGLVAIVCSAANYGYALNELFDRSEDLRGGRINVAAGMSSQAMWAVILCSAGSALALAAALAGLPGLLLTVGELALPLAYSVPPVRIKERGWLGICADAAAAHIFPAMMALLIVSRQRIRFSGFMLVAVAAVWSAAAGLRGILSHQLKSQRHDQAAGLVTVVHILGHARLEAFVIFVLLPIEMIAFSALLIQSGPHVFLKIAACVYISYELLKYRLNAFPVVVFRPEGQRFIPFVDEGFYKVWGPLALSLDCGFTDPLYLALFPLYVYLFWPRVRHERDQIVFVYRSILASILSASVKLRH